MRIQIAPGHYRQATPEEMVRISQPAPVLDLPCVYLGEPDGQLEECQSCNGRVQLKTHHCSIFSRCTTHKTIPPLACCTTCVRRLPAFRKHLLFHLYPRSGSNWRWHCNKILEHSHLFDGRRIVAVVTDGTTDPIEWVQDALHDARVELKTLPNDPNLREVASFLPLFAAVSDLTSPEDVTLYAHGKGVTNHSWPDGGATIQLWAETLWETLCDYWPVVAQTLLSKPIAGSLLRLGSYWHNSQSQWHYSGSWFWFRNHDLFRKDWQRIDRFVYGIEPYPGLHFAVEEAGVVFGEPQPQGNPDWTYLREVWDRTLLPALQTFRQKNTDRRTHTLQTVTPRNGIRLDLGCGSNKRPGWYGLDVRNLPGVDLVHDLERFPYPLASGSCQELRASQVVEHVSPHGGKFLKVMDEWWRILTADGQLTIITPEGGSSRYLRDPTHCNPCTEETWHYFDPAHAELYGIYQPSPWRILSSARTEEGDLLVVLQKRN